MVHTRHLTMTKRVKTSQRSTEGKDKLLTDRLTEILAGLDHFYPIYGAFSWNSRLQSPQPSHFSYC